MSDSRSVTRKSGSSRIRIQLDPMTRAVRSVLAASTMALALGATGHALAAPTACDAPANVLDCAAQAIDSAPVFDLTVVEDAGPAAFAAPAFAPLSIVDYGPGDVVIENSDPIEELSYYSPAIAILGYSADGNVDITNHAGGDLLAASVYGSAIGIYGYAGAGEASVDNAASIAAASLYGISVGIFAAGQDVDVSNSGTIETYSYGWTAGIEAESSDSVTVVNTGDILASASDTYFRYDGFVNYIGANQGGHAMGIYVVGGAGGAQVTNSGNIYVSGGYVAGVDVTATGDISIDNSGSIVSGPGGSRVVDYSTNPYGIVTVYGVQLSDGIAASSLGDGTHIGISNSGDIHVSGLYGSNGITATASGYGSTVEIGNTGSIYAGQYFKYGYGAYAIVASADSDATVDNAGTIEVLSAGAATGAAALSFAGEALVTNTAQVTVTSRSQITHAATGLLAFAGNGEARVENSGDVSAISYGYIGRAIDAQGYNGATVVNDGTLYVDAKYAQGVYAVALGGDAMVINGDSGQISFNSIGNGNGAGIFAVGVNGSAMVENAGGIYGRAQGQATGIFGLSLTADAHLVNDGTIDVATATDAALGMFARANYGTAQLTNTGDISVSTFDSSEYIPDFGFATYGMLGQGGDVGIHNTGNIVVEGEGYATGIAASAVYDVEIVSSGGNIDVYTPGGVVTYAVYVPPGGGGGYYYYGNGARSAGDVRATLEQARAAVPMDGGYGEGEYGYYRYYYVLVGQANGILAESAVGDISVSNASDISSIGLLVSASGINVRAGDDATVSNTGDILAATYYGTAYGLRISDNYQYGAGWEEGDLTVVNSGDIEIVAVARSAGRGAGISASRVQGSVDISNSGDIYVYSGGRSYGIAGRVTYGQVSVTNSGDITMYSPTDAQIGIQADAGNFFMGGGDVSVVNSGHIQVQSNYGFANGIGAIAGSVMNPYGDSYINNSGQIDVLGHFNAAGIQTRASRGDATVINSGDISIQTHAVSWIYQPDQTVGVAALTFFGGDMTVRNSGDVTVLGYANSYGLYAKSSSGGTMSIINSGDVYAHSELAQYGVEGPYGGYYGVPLIIARAAYAYSYSGDVQVGNTGSLVAAGGDTAIGIHAVTVSGDIVVTNAGDIHAGGSRAAVGVLLGNYALQPYGDEAWTPGTSTLNNSGTISAEGGAGAGFAVIGGWAADTINNAGDMIGTVSLYASDDTFNNLAGGVLDLTGHSLRTGDGDDTVNNALGGVIVLEDGSIELEAGDNAFRNRGLIVVNGDSLIDMGGDAPAAASLAGFQSGLFQAMAVSAPITVAAALDSGPLVNDGRITLADGASDDTLTIAGDLSGTGQIDLDASLLDGSSDHVVVEGDVLAGTVQTVNLALEGVPVAGSDPFEIVTVTGSAAANAFVGGHINGLSASDFLDAYVAISTRQAGGDVVFLAGFGVAGLNDTGSMTAGLAPGAAGFINSQVGTFRQRLGVNPYGDPDDVLSAFYRVYRDEGDVRPGHVADNFGDGGNFDFNQKSSGEEVGINANVFGNFHAGILLGNADSRQRLIDGDGQIRMDGMTIGAYATWYVVDGFYVDLSARKMTADAMLTSASGSMETRVDMSALSLEGGYQWKVGDRFALVPQLQYTRAEVGGIRALRGENVDFRAEGGTYTRGRLGLEANMSLRAGSAQVTPYGSINVVRIFEGESAYTVADSFRGSTSVTGTSSMAELGVGVQKGSLGLTIGANWTNGGALDGFFGGQATVRYAW
jgi:outer membrane autotransporter protein